jgi:hypothetical protein
MKTIALFIFSAFITCWSAESASASVTVESPVDSVQTLVMAKVLLTRLDEINAIDKSDLSSSETRKLRREVRVIKGDLKELDGGHYLPVGTLMILLLVPFIIFNVAQ